MAHVNRRRRYSSPLREQRAASTRRAVLDAAQQLFVERGYGATTLEQVAARAGVSKPTVFSAVGNKQALLREIRDRAIAGDDAPVPVADRPSAAAIREASDQHQAVQLLAAHLTSVAARYAPIYEVLRGAATSGEPDLRDLWEVEEQQRHAGAEHWVGVLAQKGPLRGGMNTDTATDVLWLIMSPDNYHKLVHVRRWEAARYQDWLADTLTALLV